MDYCEEVMEAERERDKALLESIDPLDQDLGTTNAVAPDSGRYVYDIMTIITLTYFTCNIVTILLNQPFDSKVG